MRRTKEEAEHTREAILNAATDLFAQKGVQSTSLVEIAENADVTRGAIYWHFKNKLEIFEALHDKLHKEFIEVLVQDLKYDHPEPLQQMQNTCTKLMLVLADDKQKQKTLNLFLIKCNYDGELASFKVCHKQHKEESLTLLKQYMDRAKRKGFLASDADTGILATAINCYMKGILFTFLNDPDGFDLKAVAPQLMEIFFSKLNPRGSINLDQS